MQINKLNNVWVLVCALSIAACGGSGGDGDDEDGSDIPVTTTNYVVTFSPQQVIGNQPAPASITATASLSTARGFGTTASGSVTVNGATATSVTINVGYAGESGPVAVTLTDAGGGRWTVPAGTELDDDEFFRLDATGYYVSIQTAQGELRGQIRPPDWIVAVFDVDSTGVIPQTTSSGTAKAGLALQAGTLRIRTRMTVSGISDPIGAALRNAVTGARGDVFIPMEQANGDPNVWGTRDINNPNADDILTTTGLSLLNAGSIYFSLETATNMAGELRKQILADEISVFDAALTDIEVVTSGPPVVSNATGTATVTWVEITRAFGLAVNTDITDAVSVSLHQGAPGTIGPVVFALLPDVTLPGNWVLAATELTEEQATAFMDGEFYVNVVTSGFVEGELRGQLVESAPATSLSIDATVDESTRQQTPIDAGGGTMSLTTSNGVFVTTRIRDLTVAEMKDFSMTEITSVDRFPADGNLLAAVQMGPAGELFSQPVTLTFDVTGMRRPGSLLFAFRSDNNGENLRLLPLRDALGNLGYYSTALSGTQVSVDVVGFSNIGIFEMLEDEAPDLIWQFLRQGRDFELPEEFLLRVFNVALDTDLTIEEIDDLADNMLADFVRLRRQELAEIMVEFMRRDSLTPDDELEYLEINLAVHLVNALDFTGLEDDRYVTSKQELQDSISFLVNFATVYGAGLHLQCFVDPEGVEEALDSVGLIFMMKIVEELLAGGQDIDVDNVAFQELSAEAEAATFCFNQAILDAYFQSFDVPGDQMTGETTNIVSTTVDNLTGDRSTNNPSDIDSDLQFIEPQVVSSDPVTFEFLEAADGVGFFMDTVRIVLDDPDEDGVRTGRIELAEEESFETVTSPEEQADGERPVITATVSVVASGPVRITPNGIEITYSFDSLERSNGLLRNLSRQVTGDVAVSKSYTPLSFSDEIELFE